MPYSSIRVRLDGTGRPGGLDRDAQDACELPGNRYLPVTVKFHKIKDKYLTVRPRHGW